MKALVVYDSAFGNTEKIAVAIGEALKASQSAEVRHVKDVLPTDLTGLTLLIVGSPTQAFNATEVMRKFIGAIPDGGLRGVSVAAFDTRMDGESFESSAGRFAAKLLLFRFAAKPIAHALEAKGGHSVIAPEGFLVSDKEGPLLAGELDRAAAWAHQIAALVPA